MKLLLLFVLVGAVYGLPQRKLDESRDLAILQRYLQKALHEIDRSHMIHPRGLPEPTVSLDEILAAIDTLVHPDNIAELNKVVLDIDIDVAAEQALAVVEAFFEHAPVTMDCIDVVSLMGTLPLTMTENMIPVRILLMSAITRIMLLAVSETEEFDNIPQIDKSSLGEVVIKLKAAGKDIALILGLPEDAKIAVIAAFLGQAILHTDETTTGKTLVAVMIQALITVIDSSGSALETANCDPAAVQARLSTLLDDIKDLITKSADINNVKNFFNVGDETAAEIEKAIKKILTADATYSVLTNVIEATDTDTVTLGEVMAKITVKSIFALAVKRAIKEKELHDVLDAAQAELPSLDTPIADVTIIDVIRTSLAITNHMQSTLGFTCEPSKSASLIAGIAEMKRLDYSLANPVTHLLKGMLDKLVELVDPNASSEEVEQDIEEELSGFFRELFAEVVLPLADKIDELNNDVVFKTRFLPFIIRVVFLVSDPKTLHDLVDTAMGPILAAFTLEEACPTEPSMTDIREELAEALSKVETVATTKIETMAAKLKVDLSIPDETAATMTILLKDISKVILPAINADLLEIEGALDIDPTVESARSTIGGHIGAHIYREVWTVKMIKTLAKLKVD